MRDLCTSIIRKIRQNIVGIKHYDIKQLEAGWWEKKSELMEDSIKLPVHETLFYTLDSWHILSLTTGL